MCMRQSQMYKAAAPPPQPTDETAAPSKCLSGAAAAVGLQRRRAHELLPEGRIPSGKRLTSRQISRGPCHVATVQQVVVEVILHWQTQSVE